MKKSAPLSQQIYLSCDDGEAAFWDEFIFSQEKSVVKADSFSLTLTNNTTGKVTRIENIKLKSTGESGVVD